MSRDATPIFNTVVLEETALSLKPKPESKG